MTGRRLALIACPLVAICLYLPTLRHEFVFDDRGAILENRLMYDLRAVPEILTSPYWTEPGQDQTLYRPLTSLSFALDRAIVGGMEAWWYHLVNVMLHGLATLLVTMVALRFLPDGLPAAAAGLLFAVHPVHVEAVAGVVGRAEILAAIGALLCLLLHRRAQRESGTPRRLAAIGACFAFLLAFLSKESAIAAPFLCALADWAAPVAPRARAHSRLPLYAGYVVVVSLVMLLRVGVLGSSGLGQPIPFVDNPAAAAGPVEGRLTALGAVIRYGVLLLWPARLSADYSYDQIPVIDSFAEPLAVMGFAVVLLVVGGGAWLVQRGSNSGFVLLFVAVAASPIANLLFPIGTLLAERLMYLPSVGVCLLLGWIMSRPNKRHLERVTRAVMVVLLLLAAGRTWVRLPEWRNDLALYSSAAAVSPRTARVRYNLGNAYLKVGGYEEAEESFRAALAIYPGFTSARINMGLAILQQGRPDEALAVLGRAVEEEPEEADLAVNLGSVYRSLGDPARAEAEFERALALDPNSAQAWNNLGTIDFERGQPERAAERLRRAVDLDPGVAIFRVNLGDALLASGRSQAAAEEFEAAERLDPDDPEVHRGLGEIALRAGDLETAERELRRSVKGEAASARAANLLGYVLALRGDAAGAADWYQRAVSLDPTLYDAHRSLGLLYAQELGDPESAARHLETSLELAPEQPNAERLRELLRKLNR